jgi:hypothetical protein
VLLGKGTGIYSLPAATERVAHEEVALAQHTLHLSLIELRTVTTAGVRAHVNQQVDLVAIKNMNEVVPQVRTVSDGE